jgi:hypothetical protein
MSEASSAQSRVFQVVLAVVLIGSMGVLVVTLKRSHDRGRAVFGAYVAKVRAGAHVGSAVGGVEADALERKLRQSYSVSVGNFAAQHGTSCYSATLHGSDGNTDVHFVLGVEDSAVVALSASRECDCPEDPDEPCRLAP